MLFGASPSASASSADQIVIAADAPEATITAWACSVKSPLALRELLLPRSALSGWRIVPLTRRRCAGDGERIDAWRNLKVRRPLAWA